MVQNRNKRLNIVRGLCIDAMEQTPENYFDAMPCNQCGSSHMIQEAKQSESVYLDDEGQIDHIEPRDFVEIQAVWCAECDEKVWEL